jgi:hypothetical protein
MRKMWADFAVRTVYGQASPSPSPSASPTNIAPIGIFDGVSGTQAIGWACDMDVPATAIDVQLYIDDQPVGTARAERTGEEAIGPYCGGLKNRRYAIDIPDRFKDGTTHTAKITALDNITNGINTQLNGSPKTFTLALPTVKVGDIEPIPGGDSDVDLSDFTLFVEDYNKNNLRSDFNHDGFLTLGDFILLAENYEK